MKSMNLKRLVLSTAIMGASSLAFAATADQATTNSYDVPQSESRAVTPSTPADRNVTNPNVEGYSSTDSDSSLNNRSTTRAQDAM